jgi:hypothetical protein
MLQVKQPIAVRSVQAELMTPTELRLEGTLSDEVAQRELGAHLRELQAHIASKKLTSFTVDVRKLTFVNSGALRLFVDLASRAQADGYTLVFKIDHAITWHRLSFSVLKSLAPDRIELVDTAPTPGQPAS